MRFSVACLAGLGLCFALETAAQTGSAGDPVAAIAQSLRTQDFDHAVAECEAALQQTPNDKRIWVLRGMAYAGKTDPPSALKSYQHAMQLDAEYLPALEGAAQILYQEHSPAAKPLLRKILAQSPNDPISSTMLAFLEYEAKDCPSAIPHFEKGGSVLAAQPTAQAAYGACLAQSARYEEAIPLFEQALSSAPSTPGIRFDLALAQWKANQPQAALQTLQGANGQAAALLLSADIYESINDTQRAVDLLREAILADPRNVDAYLDFAYLSFDHASLQVGIDILTTGIGQLPAEGRLYLVRGILYAQLGKFEAASEDFAAADHFDPGLTVLGAVEGLAASQQHKSAAALSAFRAAARAHPSDALTQYLLAEALSELGASQDSAEYAEEVRAANRACRLDPTMVAPHDLLATLYLRDERTSLAVEQSRAALAIDPTDQQALYHLILALRKTGQKDQIPALLRQMTAARNEAQTRAMQNKHYQLQEIPISQASR